MTKTSKATKLTKEQKIAVSTAIKHTLQQMVIDFPQVAPMLEGQGIEISQALFMIDIFLDKALKGV